MRSLVRYVKEFARAHLTAVRYPPGRLRFRDPAVHAEPRALLELTGRFGPVFKQWPGRHTTYVLGNRLARQFLAENEENVSGVSVNLTPIVPGGWIRQMRGDAHQHYRRIMLDGLQATLLPEHRDAMRSTIAAALDAIATHAETQTLGTVILQRLRGAARAIMIRLFLGVTEDRPLFAELVRLYDRLGPDAPAPRIRPPHAEAYRAIRALVLEEIARLRAGSAAPFSSVLRRLVERDALDETALGHVIYMVEPGYFDTSSLWRWMLKILTDNPATVAEIAPAFAAGGETARRMAEAICSECLRLEQAEVLFKRVHEGCEIDGMRVPANSELKVCLWEGHKDANVFPDPFVFRPQRFLEREYSLDEYAPFGLDRHRCPGSAIVIYTTAIFIEELFARRPWRVVADGTTVHGIYHWEPNPAFAVRLGEPTSTSGAARPET